MGLGSGRLKGIRAYTTAHAYIAAVAYIGGSLVVPADKAIRTVEELST